MTTPALYTRDTLRRLADGARQGRSESAMAAELEWTVNRVRRIAWAHGILFPLPEIALAKTVPRAAAALESIPPARREGRLVIRTVGFDPRIHGRLERIAEARRMTLQQLVRAILADAVTAYPEEGDGAREDAGKPSRDHDCRAGCERTRA